MKRTLSLAVLAVVGVALLIGCAADAPPTPAAKGTAAPVKVAVRPGKRGSYKTVVSFIVDENGNCVVSDGVGTLGGRGNSNKKKIVWLVWNECNAPMYVAITHYEQYNDPDDPSKGVKAGAVKIVKDDPNTDYYDSNSTPIGVQTEQKLDTTILKDAGASHLAYKYWICTSKDPFSAQNPAQPSNNVSCLDPDVDVWP